MQDLSLYKNILSEYDDIVIGKKKSFSSIVFHKLNQFNERNALVILQYAFTKYLRWTPEAVANDMTKAIIKKMHLEQVMSYVKFPIEYDNKNDYYYLATLIYPQFGLSLYDKTVHTYEKVLDHKISKFPKGYFFGSDGAVRAGICLQYMINHFIFFTSINELYHIFGTDIGYKYLKDYKLLAAYKDVFETPVDYLHFSLPDEQKNEFFFRFYKFKFLMELISDDGRKQHTDVQFLLKIDSTNTVTLSQDEEVNRKILEAQKRKERRTKAEIIRQYQMVLSDQSVRFPRKYFEDTDGKLRARVCLQYLLTTEMPDADIRDLYYLFSTGEGEKYLKTKRLNEPCRKLYAAPIDYLHDAVVGFQNQFLFRFYKFVSILMREIYGRSFKPKLSIKTLEKEKTGETEKEENRNPKEDRKIDSIWKEEK